VDRVRRPSLTTSTAARHTSWRGQDCYGP
jgi:hypothetical protein